MLAPSFMFDESNRTRRLLPLALLALASALRAGPATAQSVDFVQGNIDREDRRDDDLDPFAISYSDCVDDVTTTVRVNAPVRTTMEVWAGGPSDDCVTEEKRDRTDGTDCWLVASESVSEQPIQLELSAKVMANRTGNCEAGTDSELNIFFLAIEGGVVQGSDRWSTRVDLEGPAPPSRVSAKVGENQLPLSWSVPSEDDLDGFRFYCVPTGTSGGEAGGTSGASGTPGASGAGGDAGVAAGDSAGAGGSAGASGTLSAGATATPSTTSHVAVCGQSVLVAGELPDEQYRCGSATGLTTTRGSARHLDNGTLYAVAVSGVDNVGNTGVLSNIVCETPEELQDFFEVYRSQGGKGGGGFCSVTREPPALGMLGLLAGLAAAWIGRRRARPRLEVPR